MKYETMTKAVFEQRPNRFIAHCKLQGKVVVAHVKNTGRCREFLLPGAKVWLQDHRQEKKQRKTEFSLIAVEKETEQGTLLINMDSQAPNRVAEEGLLDGSIRLPLAEGEEICSVRREVTFGNSRFDLQVCTNRKIWYVEVKGVTLEETEQGIRTARFPDAPTERGVKHIHELTAAKEAGHGAAVLFIIQMPQVDLFRPNWQTHCDFGIALQQAQKAGVAVLAYDCTVTPDSLTAAKPVEVELSSSETALWFFTDDKEPLLRLLDEEDRTLLSTLHKEKAGEQSALAQALMKRAVKELGFSAVQIMRSEKGAPITDQKGLYVSASHTEGCCAAAAALHPVGIDVESIAAAREKVITRMFSKGEQAYLDSCGDRDLAFTKLWTLKEAYGKMRGIGLSAVKEVEFFEEDGPLICTDRNVRISTEQRDDYLISKVEYGSD